MRSRSKLVVCAGIAVVAAWSAACAGILGDFSESASPLDDGSVGGHEPFDSSADVVTSADAPSTSDAPETSPSDAGPQPDDGSVGSDAQDTGAPACGPKCATALGANGTHTCAVMGDQTVFCWGNNANGESGPSADGGPTPTLVPGIGPARLVKAGDTASCALLVDKSVWCWGSNARGTLGVPDASATADGGVAPVQVFPPGTVADLSMVTPISLLLLILPSRVKVRLSTAPKCAI